MHRTIGRVRRQPHAVTVAVRVADPHGSRKPFQVSSRELRELMWDKKPWRGQRLIVR